MEGETLTSLDFYTVKSQTFITILLTITMVVVVLLLLYLGIYILGSRVKACTDAPSSPQNVKAGFVSDLTFRVFWDRIPDVTNYTVYVGQTPIFTRVQSINVTTSTKPSADINGLEKGRTYYIFVSATNACGESVDSARITYIFI